MPVALSPEDISDHFAELAATLDNDPFAIYTELANGFDAPETAFLVYNFWHIDALAAIGRRDEAWALFIDLLAHRKAFGLLSEEISPETAALWGNIPQTYSMAGIINSAMRLSVRWEDVWCRVSS